MPSDRAAHGRYGSPPPRCTPLPARRPRCAAPATTHHHHVIIIIIIIVIILIIVVIIIITIIVIVITTRQQRLIGSGRLEVSADEARRFCVRDRARGGLACGINHRWNHRSRERAARGSSARGGNHRARVLRGGFGARTSRRHIT